MSKYRSTCDGSVSEKKQFNNKSLRYLVRGRLISTRSRQVRCGDDFKINRGYFIGIRCVQLFNHYINNNKIIKKNDIFEIKFDSIRGSRRIAGEKNHNTTTSVEIDTQMSLIKFKFIYV